MKLKVILFFVLGFFICSSLTWSHPPKRVTGDDDAAPDTTKRKNNQDSIRAAREYIADSIKAQREHVSDSIKSARKQKSDSVAAVRKYKESKRYKDSVAKSRNPKKTTAKTGTQTPADSVKNARRHIMDSTAAVRKYKESKKYKDSVEKSRLKKANAIKKTRQSSMDSLKDVRKHITDSIASSRKTRTDSVKTIQKHRSDSLARIKKYKESKRYTDSVTIVKRNRSDSIKHTQKVSRDKMAARRKHSLDSANTIRKHSMDSVKTVRTKNMDSVKLVRKKKVDSLAKVKADKEKLAKAKEKKKELDLKLKMELKIKQKHEAWSNKSMLKKRWGPLRRLLQNSFTHYNYYFNAKRKMDEAMENMQRTRKENYDSVIGLYSFDPNRDSTLLSADMDSIVRKVSVGIQIHDPRVKWSNDLYLLLGQAYYYRGSYENASIAFRYIISSDEAKKKAEAKKHGYSRSKEAPSFLEGKKKRFLGHKSVHNDAILWLARTYTAANQAENAESVLSLLGSDAKLPEDLKGKLSTEKAFALLAQGNYDAAAEQLAVTEDDRNQPDWLRVRAAFIHGQLLQSTGRYAEAATSFEKVLTYYPKIEMDFYARKFIAYNKVMAGHNVADAMRPLKNVVNDGKYVNYYDQVYYVLGTTAARGNLNDEAIKYFIKSTATPKATKKQKALSYAALGDVYYSQASYGAAKNAYDSATKYGLSIKDINILTAVQRSKGLEEISGPVKVIHDQDSLLELAKRSKKEQQSAVKRALRAMEQKQQDSIIAAESSGVSAAAPEPTEAPDPSAANWYFGNPMLMQQGSADFKRKWGNRPLTDNWRRAAGAVLAANSSNNGRPADDEGEEPGSAATASGLPTEESMLAKIPNTPQQKELAVKVQQRAYMLLARAYLKLENYDQAIHTLDTMDQRYPAHNLKEESLYLRYQIALKQNKLEDAQRYSQQLVAQFPNSQYAGLLRPKQSEAKGAATDKPVAAYYDETYDLLMNHQYTEVLMHINVARKQYDNPVFKKRLDIVEASTYAGMADYDKADTLLVKFLKANPASDSLASWAKEVQNYVKEMRAGGKPSWYVPTPPGSEPVAKDKPKTAPETPKPVEKPKEPEIPSAYTYRGDKEHYCIIVIPGIDSRTMPLKQDIRNFVATKYASSELSMLLDLYTIDQGVVVIRQFMNATFASSFMNDLLASPILKGYTAEEIQVMTISADNYRKLFADKNVAPYSSFYKNKY